MKNKLRSSLTSLLFATLLISCGTNEPSSSSQKLPKERPTTYTIDCVVASPGTVPLKETVIIDSFTKPEIAILDGIPCVVYWARDERDQVLFTRTKLIAVTYVVRMEIVSQKNN